MERLVEQAYGIAQIIKAGTAYNGKKCYNTCEDICKRQDYKCNEGCPIQAVISRLSDYQDTGLTPEEIPRWVPVSERLPERDTLVLLFLNSGNEQRITTGKICKSVNQQYDGEFCIGFDDAQPDFLKKEFVTHWMMLPEPPKESAEAEKERREINDIT